MSKYCVVVSDIKRLEVVIDAQTETAAIEEVKKQVEKGELNLGSANEQKPIYHIKY